MINNRTRLTIIRILLPVFLIFSLSFTQRAQALLPLLFAEFASAAVDTFLIRSVARTVVGTVGSAANDASWTQLFMDWITVSRAVGSIVVSQNADLAGLPSTIEIQMASPLSDLTKGLVQSEYYPSYPSSMLSFYSADGLSHAIPNFLSSANIDPLVAENAFVVWWNGIAKPSANIVSLACHSQTGTYSYYCAGTFSDLTVFPSALDLAETSSNVEIKDGIKRLKKSGLNWLPDATDPDWTVAEIALYAPSPAYRFDGLLNGQVSHLDIFANSNDYGMRFEEQVTPTTLLQKTTLLNYLYIPVAVDVTQGAGALSAYPGDATSPSSGSVVFPSDYARQGEAAAAAVTVAASVASLSTHIDTVHNDLSVTTTLGDPTLPTDADMPTFGNTFNNLLAWRVPAHASACPKPSMDMSAILGAGSVYTLSSHCDLLNNYSAQLRTAMLIVFSIIALFIFLRA